MKAMRRAWLLSFLASIWLVGCPLCHTLSIQVPSSKSSGILLARKIRACKANVECAISHLNHDESALFQSDEPIIAAMDVCGRARRHDVTLELYYNSTKIKSENRDFSFERCRAMAISICGRCNETMLALQLLQEAPTPQAGSWNAAIAACGGIYWREALDIIETRMPASMISTLSCNAVLTCLVKAKQGRHALELLNKMSSPKSTLAPPDRVSFHRTLAALIGAEMLDHAYELLIRMEQDTNPKLRPNHETYYVVSNAYAKRGNMSMAKEIDMRRDSNTDSRGVNHGLFQNSWKDQAKNMIRVGTGKNAYWIFGHYIAKDANITVAFSANRNPSKNGIKMLFFDNDARNNKSKIGYLLMINSLSNTNNKGTSSLLGMYLDPNERQRGLSKVILSIWVRLCLEAGIKPVTGLIHKPILALVLQRGLGFTPTGKSGVDVELCPNHHNGGVVLYSPAGRSLHGAFSPWDLKTQNIALTNTPPSPRGRIVRVGCKFAAPKNQSEWRIQIEQMLSGSCGSGGLHYKASAAEMRRIFVGV